MSSITRSSGSDMSKNARASGRAAREQRALAPEHAIQPPARRVREREQPQRLAGRRAVDDDRVPLAGLGVALELEQAEQLVGAGRDGQLLGGDPLDAALGEHAAEPLLRGRPVALELVLRLHLLGPDAVADVGRLGADRRCSDSASECAGSVESTSVRAPAAAQRRAVAAATDVLPTPPLPV